jgi:argininosuccinate synthase
MRYAELVYNGQWFHPLREPCNPFVDHTNATVTGTARIRLYKGRALAVAAQSPHTLYDPQLASFSMEGLRRHGGERLH